MIETVTQTMGDGMEWRIIEGDARTRLQDLPAGSVQTCVTSPPYFGLRDYGHDGQIGLEPTPDEYVAELVAVFREVRRVLRDDGTVWLNLGDSYAATVGGVGNNPSAKSTLTTNNGRGPQHGDKYAQGNEGRRVRLHHGAKPKDLLGIPWRVAFALQADGWWLRSDIVWAKPNPMPESVTDRPTNSHEYVFLLSKRERYFYDADAIREPQAEATEERGAVDAKGYRGSFGGQAGVSFNPAGRNKRSVWTIPTQPYRGAHFAVFPPALIEPCILAGSPEGGTVLDPFAGTGTTGMVALRHGRSFVGVELNREYVRMARERIIADAPLLNAHAEAACREYARALGEAKEQE